MPEYEVVTEQVIKRRYRRSIELPIDMGASTERLTDRMARTAADEGALVPFVTDEAENTLELEEKVVAVFRGDEQVWPRKRERKKVEVEAYDPFTKHPDDIDPDYEQALADQGDE